MLESTFFYTLAKVFGRHFQAFKKFLLIFLQFYYKTINKAITSEPFYSYNFIVFCNRPFLDNLFKLIPLMKFLTLGWQSVGTIKHF